METRVLWLAAVTTLIAAPARAADSPNAAGEAARVEIETSVADALAPDPTWGTSGKSSVAYVAQNFHPNDSSTTYAASLVGGNICVYRTAGPPYLEGPVNLPNGARFTDIEIRYCDSGGGTLFAYLTIANKDGTTTQPTLFQSNGTPGCVTERVTFGTPFTIDNTTNAYAIEWNLLVADPSLSLCQARLYYELQVSPAPATATFGDVPTSHPFFQFVEALVAAGITGGCGGGNYCPDNPVTRGQMAVFLSVALGLHFPN